MPGQWHSQPTPTSSQPVIQTHMSTYLCFGRVDLVHERDSLLLCRDHAHNLLLLSELQLADALKTLLQMWLYTQWVFGLRQNLQQLIIGQEEEPGEGKMASLVSPPY